MIEKNHEQLAVARQCQLVGLARSSYYYEVATETEENLAYMRLIDEQYLRTPFYGSRRMAAWLCGEGHEVNRKRVQRLMQLMGLEGIAPGPSTSRPSKQHEIYPYLLRDVEIKRPNHVWSTDVTYIPMASGFMYLAAVIDWFSRYVISWRLSNTLDAAFCIDALKAALKRGRPEIFNTDQGSQFTCREFTGVLKAAEIQISMDGRGRALDNVFVERLWRSVKYEDVYLKSYDSPSDLAKGLKSYFSFYNNERPHQSLRYGTPSEAYEAGA
jgi:putative transposase